MIVLTFLPLPDINGDIPSRESAYAPPCSFLRLRANDVPIAALRLLTRGTSYSLLDRLDSPLAFPTGMICSSIAVIKTTPSRSLGTQGCPAALGRNRKPEAASLARTYHGPPQVTASV